MNLERQGAGLELVGRIRRAPLLFLSQWTPFAGKIWGRAVFEDGRHRRFCRHKTGDFSPEEVDDMAKVVDQLRVGDLVQVEFFSFRKGSTPTTIGLARYMSASASHDYFHRGGHFVLQRFQTLASKVTKNEPPGTEPAHHG